MALAEDLKLHIGYGAFPQDDTPYTALSGRREDIIELLEATLANQRRSNLPETGFAITMPCGYEQEFREPSDIPMENLPCSCGKPERFMIKLI